MKQFNSISNPCANRAISAAKSIERTWGGYSHTTEKETNSSSAYALLSENHPLITPLSPRNHPLVKGQRDKVQGTRGQSTQWLRYVATLLLVFFVGIGNAWGTVTPTAIYSNGFENGTDSWSKSSMSSGPDAETTNVRTGAKSIKYVCSSSKGYTTKSVTFTKGTKVHGILWVKASDSKSVYLSLNSDNGSATDVGSSGWTRVVHNYSYTGSTGSKNVRLYMNDTKSSINIYVDDVVLYYDDNAKIDLKKPGNATNANATTSSITWTPGIDASDGSNAATGVQATLIFHRTGGSIGSNDLSLNDQGLYSLTSTEGPSVVGNWTLLSASLAADAESYSGTFTEGHEYAIVHRDLAYNYSSPTYVTVTSSCSAPTDPGISGDTEYDAGGTIELTASATGTTSGVTTYQWYKGDPENGGVSQGDASTSGATFTKSSCVTGDAGTYYCVISNGTDCETTTSETITVSCLSAPSAVTSLACSSQTGNSLTYTWTKASNASGYTAILYPDDKCAEDPVSTQNLGNVETVTFTSLSSSTTYYCKVQSKGDGDTYCVSGGTTDAVSGTTTTPTFTISFAGNDATSGSTSSHTGLTSGSDVSQLNTNGFVKTGYSFNGWKTNTALTYVAYGDADDGEHEVEVAVNGSVPDKARIKNVTSDITLTAQWSAINYTITHSAASNGSYTIQVASGSAVSTNTTANYGQTITLAATPSSGYQLSAWNVTKTSGGSSVVMKTANTFDMPAEAVTISPTFVAVYTVTFNSNGGSAVATQNIVAGNTASKPSDPTRTNWTFEGWQLEGEDYSFSTAVTGAITLDAVWSRNTIGNRDITEIYSADEENESEVESASSYNGTSFSLKKIDDKSWEIAKDYSSATGDGKTFNYAFLPGNSSSDTQGFQLTAKKSISSLVVYYTVTDSKFTSKDQSKSGSLTYKINTNDAVVLSSVDGSNKVAYKGTVSTIAKDDVVKLYSSANRLAIFALYATYSGNPLYVKTTVNGVKRDSITFTSGETLGNLFDDGELPTISITGYTFSGWKNAAADTTVTKSTVLTADMTIYADLEAAEYDVTLNKGTNGSTDGEGSVEMGAGSLTITTAPTAPSGYALKGYYTDTEANEGVKVAEEDGSLVEGNVTGYVTSGKWSMTSDATLYAWWGLTYDVRFFQGYGTPDTQIGETQTIASGEPATAPADPERDHYEFAGWKTGEEDPMTKAAVDAYSITEATDFVAQWTPLYSITEGSHANGSIAIKKGDDDVTEAKEGTTITLTATPNFKYVLDSWSVTYVDEEEEEQEVTVTDNQFTMPAYDVTVNATFITDTRKHILYLTTISESNTKSSDKLYAALNSVDTYKVYIEAPSTQTITNYDLVVLHESIVGTNSASAVTGCKTGNVAVLNTKSFFYGETSDNTKRWGWGKPHGGKKTKAVHVNTNYVNIKSHPLFAGLTPDANDSIQILSSIDSDNKPIQPIASFTSGKEGTTLAQVPDGTAIHELTPTQRGASSGLYLLISVYNKDLNNLNEAGQQLFKNAAAYLIAGTGYKLIANSAVSDCWDNGTYTCTDIPNFNTPNPDGTGDWGTASNWGGGKTPTSETNVVLPNDITIGTGVTALAKEVIVGDGAKLTVADGGALIVADGISLGEGSNLTLSSSSSAGLGILVMGENDGTTPASINFYSKTGMSGDGRIGNWVNQHIGTAYTEGSNDLYANYYGCQIYPYDEENEKWGAQLDKDDTMTPFKGYNLLRDTQKFPWSVEGMLNMAGTLVSNEDQSLDLYYNGSSRTENVMANSWSAPILLSAFSTEDGVDFVNAEKAIYIFNSGTRAQAEAADEASAKATSPGQYIALPLASVDWTEATTKVIPPLQGFSVYATGSSAKLNLNYKRLVYDPAAAGTTSSVQNRAPKRGKEEMPTRLHIQVEGESGYSDEVYVFERGDFSTGYDDGYDGRKLAGETYTPQLSATSTDGQMAINCVPDIENTNLTFKAGTLDTEYTMSFDYNGEETLYLYDTKAETSTLISNDNTYTFTTTDRKTSNRFAIRRSPQIATDVENVQSDDAQCTEVRKVMINGELYLMYKGTMYNVQGAVVK